MKPITYYLNFPLARQIQDCLDRLSTDQKIELAFAIGQRALDERRSADIVRRDIEGISNPVEMSIADTFECEDCHQHQPYAVGQHDEFYELCDDCFVERDTTPTYDPAELIV
jgi:hypothetical protein